MTCPDYEDWPDNWDEMEVEEQQAYLLGWRARYQWARQQDAQVYNGEVFGERENDTSSFQVDDTLY